MLVLKKKKLDWSLVYQKFLVEYKDLKSWIVDMLNRIQQQTEAASSSEAETALNLHQERRTEFDGKNHRFIALQDMARELNEKARASDFIHSENLKEIQRCTKDLIESQALLEQKCAEKGKFLQDLANYQELKEQWKNLENWCRNIETVLRSNEVGDSVIVVTSLITKHENIESSVKSQMASGAAFDSIEQRGQEMIKQGHCQIDLVVQVIYLYN